MSAPTSRLSGLSWDDFFEFPEEVHRHTELVDGELHANPPERPHQRVALTIMATLRDWARGELGTGEVTFEPLIRVAERTGFKPDVAWYPAERCPPDDQEYIDPPALVVEVLSPSTRRTDLLRKPLGYARVGVDEMWIVDIVERTAVCFRRSGDLPMYDDQALLPEGDSITSPVLDGFSMPVADLFVR